MLSLALSLATFIISVIGIPEGYVRHERGCAWSTVPGFKSKENIVTTPPYISPPIPSADLPTNFSWADQNGISLVTPVRNQGLPFNCGSCWAVAATGSISDRLRIDKYRSSGIVDTPINLAPQFALDICAEDSGLDIDCGSCNGGDAGLLFQALAKTGISDESCNPYLGITTSHWGELGYEVYMCRTCDRFGDCNYTAPNPEMVYYVDEYGLISYDDLDANITMVEAMQQEIYNRGPIACLMYAHGDSFEYYTGGILTDNTTYPGVTHYVALIGWGQSDDGVDYWIGRNSFGTWWGEKGFFRAEMGINIYNMEENCNWATLKQASSIDIKVQG